MRTALSLLSCVPVLLAPGIAQAQAAFDRTKPPALPPAPRLVMPAVVNARLANGIPTQVVEQTEVPLVQVTLTVAGGSRREAWRAPLP